MVNALPADVEEAVARTGEAEIVVGIPSFNNADAVGPLVEEVDGSLRRYFPSRRGVIVHSDGGSTDGTQDRALDAMTRPDALLQLPFRLHTAQRLSEPYHGIPGKGTAVQTIFLVAQRLGAKACVVVDVDTRNTQADWISNLVRPVVEEQFDYVAPRYAVRHDPGGGLARGIIYPMTRALYGKRIRLPVGGDVCVSGSFVSGLLARGAWDADVLQLGIDNWAGVQAVSGGYKTCEAFLGATIATPRNVAFDLSAMIAQVLGPLFREMGRTAAAWQKVRGSEPVPVFGQPSDVEDAIPAVDPRRMIESFRIGYKNLQEVWGIVLPPSTLIELKKLHVAADDGFRFGDEAWARTVYDFALGYHYRKMNQDHLLAALTPLYLGWVASFVLEMKDAGSKLREERIERLCAAYEAQKPYLIGRWRWPDRFSP